MYAPVRHEATRIIPEPSEIKKVPTGIKLPCRCGAQPHFVIHARRRRRIRNYGTGFHPVLITPNFYSSDIPELAGIDKIKRILKMFLAALPLTSLDGAVIFFLRSHHR